MNKGVIFTTFFSLGVGFVAQLLQQGADSEYLNNFLGANLINILVAVLAINSATMGIVLTKIRDLVEKHGGANTFIETKNEMLLSIKEQIVLIGAAIILLTAAHSGYVANQENVLLALNASVIAVFAYAMRILYDTARSVLIIIDFRP